MDNQEHSDKRYCLHAGTLLVGIPLDQIDETLPEVQITPFPFLSEVCCGLCSHKGQIIPVLSFEKLCGREVLEDQPTVIVMLHSEEFRVGLQVQDRPVILDLKQAQPVDSPQEGLSDHDLRFCQAYSLPEGLLLDIDLKATLESLILCP